MIEEIELGGVKVPLRDLETTPESIKQVLKLLLEERKEIKQRIEVLQAAKRKRRDSGHVSSSSLKEEKKIKREHYISNSKME